MLKNYIYILFFVVSLHQTYAGGPGAGASLPRFAAIAEGYLQRPIPPAPPPFTLPSLTLPPPLQALPTQHDIQELEDALWDSRVADVARMLDAFPQLLFYADKNGDTLLHLAVQAEQEAANVRAVIQLLFSRGASLLHNKAGENPFHLAIILDRHELLPLFVNHFGFQLFFNQTASGSTPLHVAVESAEDLETFRVLLSYRAFRNVLNQAGQNAFDMAINHGLVVAFEFLVQIMPTLVLHRSAQSGNTMLHFVVMQENRLAILFLLSHGADASVANHLGQTPLMLASPAIRDLLLFGQGSHSEFGG